MKIAVTVARYLLGLIFFVFGLNSFIHFLPQPEMQGQAAAFIGAMAATGYFTAVAVLKVLGGGLLLFNRFVPLGLLLLGPVVVNIVLFHVFLEPAGMGMALFVFVLEIFLVWGYRENYMGLFAPKAELNL